MREKVEEILEKIRPSLQADGGDVELMDVTDEGCLLYTSPSPRDRQKSRMPSSA